MGSDPFVGQHASEPGWRGAAHAPDDSRRMMRIGWTIRLDNVRLRLVIIHEQAGT